MAVLGAMFKIETKLFLRDPTSAIIVFALPVGLLLVFGMLPRTRVPSDEFGGNIPLDSFITPLAIAILIALLGLTTFPASIATYRERGVLRRLSATPVSPSGLLLAQLLVNLAAALVVLLVILGVGTLLLGIALPANLVGFVLVTVLGTAGLFSVGLMIAALAPTARAATGIGSAVFFPMLALGGVWVRKEDLPGVLAPLADVLPVGATLNGMRETWIGAAPQPAQLVALGVVTVACTGLAARLFRWE